MECQQFLHQAGQALVPPFRRAALNHDVSALNKPEVTQALHERPVIAMSGRLGDGDLVENECDARQLFCPLRMGAR
jgi:hypothetical protein